MHAMYRKPSVKSAGAVTGKQRLLFSFKRSKASAAGSGGLASRGRHIIQGGGCGAHGARPAGAISIPRAPGAHYLRRRAVAGNGGAMAAAMAAAMGVAPPRLATTFLIALWPVKFPGLLRGV